MTQTIDGVFENGLFRPTHPPPEGLREGQRVQIVFDVSDARPRKSAAEMLELATSVYEGLTEDEIDEIERIILDRSRWRTAKDE